MTKAITVRFEEEKTVTGATHEALRRVSEHLGVSQNKAVHIAINRLYDDIFPDEVSHDMPTPAELDFLRDRIPDDKNAKVIDGLGKIFRY
ncbi:hypothetical protein [Acidithiobacillus concretivorus]|uniref:Damage-inducible protein J n=1 Tax=Acidithiobacillus concretivorus TaxID=3063952 RepID=A0ABS5ZQ33_9PROT|nr:hypothetical protein [Acidithiobacillus concretivorus]MBU2738716.1 hypothetical protein [Acidithiobacillus concretivorus]